MSASELGMASDPFGDHTNADEVEQEVGDDGPDMTNDEIRKLCTTDFATHANEQLDDAKRKFLQQIKHQVLEYISGVNTSMSQSRSRVKEAAAKVTTDESQHDDSPVTIGGESDVVSDPRVLPDIGDIPSTNTTSETHESGADSSAQKGGQVSEEDSPPFTVKQGESLEFSGSLEYDPFD